MILFSAFEVKAVARQNSLFLDFSATLPHDSPDRPPSHAQKPQLILASTSPFRRQLLARLGLPFATAEPAVDETPLPGETPEASALRLSEAKARAVASATFSRRLDHWQRPGRLP
jgi:hypothetical protein